MTSYDLSQDLWQKAQAVPKKGAFDSREAMERYQGQVQNIYGPLAPSKFAAQGISPYSFQRLVAIWLAGDNDPSVARVATMARPAASATPPSARRRPARFIIPRPLSPEGVAYPTPPREDDLL